MIVLFCVSQIKWFQEHFEATTYNIPQKNWISLQNFVPQVNIVVFTRLTKESAPLMITFNTGQNTIHNSRQCWPQMHLFYFKLMFTNQMSPEKKKVIQKRNKWNANKYLHSASYIFYFTLFPPPIKCRAMIHINVHKNTGNLVLNSLILKINLIVVSFDVIVSNKCVQLPSDLPPILYIHTYIHTYIYIYIYILSGMFCQHKFVNYLHCLTAEELIMEQRQSHTWKQSYLHCLRVVHILDSIYGTLFRCVGNKSTACKIKRNAIKIHVSGCRFIIRPQDSATIQNTHKSFKTAIKIKYLGITARHKLQSSCSAIHLTFVRLTSQRTTHYFSVHIKAPRLKLLERYRN